MQDRPDHLHRHPDRGGTKLDRQPGHLRIPNARIQVRMMQNYSLKRPNQRLFFSKKVHLQVHPAEMLRLQRGEDGQFQDNEGLTLTKETRKREENLVTQQVLSHFPANFLNCFHSATLPVSIRIVFAKNVLYFCTCGINVFCLP